MIKGLTARATRKKTGELMEHLWEDDTELGFGDGGSSFSQNVSLSTGPWFYTDIIRLLNRPCNSSA